MGEPIDEPWEPGHDVDEGYALFTKERRVVADDGTPIAATVRNPGGPAVPLLFANGWSCSDAYWGLVLPRFEAAGHPCVLPDTRGHGRSGLPRHPGRGARNLSIDDLSMPRIARDLVAVLDDAEIERAVVVGHSMGVQTALEVYRQVPDRVAGLVLIAGTAENPAKTFYGSSIGDRTFPIGAAVVRWFPEVLAPVWATIGPASVVPYPITTVSSGNTVDSRSSRFCVMGAEPSTSRRKAEKSSCSSRSVSFRARAHMVGTAVADVTRYSASARR